MPDSYYGITKFAAERYVHSTAERPDLGFDFAVTSLRMFSVFGPGQSYNNPYQGVLGIFSGNILRGEPITIFGDGEQTRDFVFVEDIVDGGVVGLAAGEGSGHQSRRRALDLDQSVGGRRGRRLRLSPRRLRDQATRRAGRANSAPCRRTCARRRN